MGESVKKNYLYNLTSQILMICIPVITTPYISRVLGAKAIGDFSYTTGIVSYFCLIAMLGTANYAQREIAKNRNDSTEVGQIFNDILWFRILMVSLSLIIYLLFINLPWWNQYKKLFLFQIVSFISWSFDITWLYQGLEEFKTIAIRNIIIKVLATVLIFISVKSQDDLVVYTIIYCLSDLVGNITLWFGLKNKIKNVSFCHVDFKRHMRGIIELFVPNIALQLYTVFDKTMLGSLVNTLEVGYYSQAEKIIKILLTAISSLFVVLLPKFAFLSAERNVKESQYYYHKAIDYTFCMALPMTVGCVMVSSYFVPVFFGKGYDMVVPLMQILSILFIVMSLEKLFGTILIAYEKQNLYTISVSIAAVVNVVLNVIFICLFHLNAIGVAIASVIAESVAMGVQIAYLPKEFDKKYLLHSFMSYLKPAFIMMICIYMVQKISVSVFVQLAIDVATGICVYFLILIFVRNPLIKEILVLIMEKIQKLLGKNDDKEKKTLSSRLHLKTKD